MRRPTWDTIFSMMCKQMCVVFEADLRKLQLAPALDVDAVKNGSPGCLKWKLPSAAAQAVPDPELHRELLR